MNAIAQANTIVDELRRPPTDWMDDLVGKTASEGLTWAKRGAPSFIRFVLRYPTLGSITGLLNIYYGLGKDIVRSNQIQHKYAKYWGFVWAMRFFYFEVQNDHKNGHQQRLRLKPNAAWHHIEASRDYKVQMKSKALISAASVRAEVQQGIIDAADIMNRLMETAEQQVAQSLQEYKGAVPQSELTSAYVQRAQALRKEFSTILMKELFSKLPSKHVKHLLGY